MHFVGGKVGILIMFIYKKEGSGGIFCFHSSGSGSAFIHSVYVVPTWKMWEMSRGFQNISYLTK